jgi:hypothetical protein
MKQGQEIFAQAIKHFRTIKDPDAFKVSRFLGEARWDNRFEKVKEPESVKPL